MTHLSLRDLAPLHLRNPFGEDPFKNAHGGAGTGVRSAQWQLNKTAPGEMLLVAVTHSVASLGTGAKVGGVCPSVAGTQVTLACNQHLMGKKVFSCITLPCRAIRLAQIHLAQPSK